MMFCSIYIISNTENTKVYIGQTWKPIDLRFKEHQSQRRDVKRRSTKLARAMNKYGVNKFNVQLLTIVSSQEIADYWERFFIEKFNSVTMGYNLKDGGSHGQHSPETIAKISTSKSGKIFSDTHRRQLSLAKLGKSNPHMPGNKFFQGKTHSEETRFLLSKINTGNHLSELTREKISKSATGKPKMSLRRFSTETEDQIRREYIGETTLKQLSIKFECSIATVYRIIKRSSNGK